MRPYRVLFVCTGNICRSPLAEALFAHYVRALGLEDRFACDSAGIDSWHVGDPADPRTRRVAAAHGVDVPSIARQVRSDDFDRFDLIVAMDRGHLRALQSRATPDPRATLQLMRDYDRPENRGRDVPDPYYGGADGFEAVYQMLALCCRTLLDALKEKTQPKAEA